jgi:hypothetical protein
MGISMYRTKTVDVKLIAYITEHIRFRSELKMVNERDTLDDAEAGIHAQVLLS